MTLGHVVGPLPPRQVPGVHISPFRVIPKGHTPGKWQLIVDLSSPAGGSINDDIPAEWCSLSYIKVDGVARHVAQLQRSVIGKDGHSASVQNLVPVHPDDRALLGMKWEGGVYIDTRLPFGLRSAPNNIFGVVYLEPGSEVHTPLPGQLHHSGQSRLHKVCSKSCSHP